jgi:aminoglycoside phosphotransferase (APT) family kinase protein
MAMSGLEPEAVAAALERWLPRAVPELAAPQIVGLERPSGTGFSNQTFVFDVVSEGGRRGFALQAAPVGDAVFSEYDMRRMFLLQRGLARHSEVPVAEMVACEEDPSILGAPFYVMTRVRGEVPRDEPPYHSEGFLHEAAVPERVASWWSGVEVLVHLHAVDPPRAGLDFLSGGWQAPGVAAKLASWERFMRWAAAGETYDLIERGLEWLRRGPPADPEHPVVTWGDAKPGNVMFRGTRAVAVFDWELASLGRSEEDVAHWLYMDRFSSEGRGVSRLPGLPGRDETVAFYEARSGRRMEDLDWWEVYSAWRLAVIIYRIMCLFRAAGVLPPEADPAEVNVANGLLATVLDER